MGGHAYCHWAEALGVTNRGRRELQGVIGGPLLRNIRPTI
ncbi:hypothetical protein BJA01nite_85260 [Bradyrhizobium japonicum]|nr:hypothetical protein BJA01nite_85260 [Bradyrhizobium japonicum]